MKAKLLRRLRRYAREEVTIYSITKSEGIVTGMHYGYNSAPYRDLFQLGDTEEDVMRKAFYIYIKENIQMLRKRYKKYSRRFKNRLTNKPQ